MSLLQIHKAHLDWTGKVPDGPQQATEWKAAPLFHAQGKNLNSTLNPKFDNLAEASSPAPRVNSPRDAE